MDNLDLSLPLIADTDDKSSPFINCIRNKYRHIRKWAKRTGTNCFRVYDREMHHYPFAIDFYAGRFLVQYFSPHRDEEEPSKELYEEVVSALRTIFQARTDQIFWRSRIRRKKTEQYEKLDELDDFFIAYEYGVKFNINLTAYLDTGLFLDHRETRRLVAKASLGKRLLNLFAYTCSFSVHAAVQGATFTKSVDMSNTYTNWGKKNFILNDLSLKNNEIVRADCLKFLLDEKRSGIKYDIIVIDPPTISRSKKMTQMFDVQEDYIFLIQQSLKLLSPSGTIYFSTNSRRFIFNEEKFEGCRIIDISEKTIPIDFNDPKIHRCWKIFPGLPALDQGKDPDY